MRESQHCEKSWLWKEATTNLKGFFKCVHKQMFKMSVKVFIQPAEVKRT